MICIIALAHLLAVDLPPSSSGITYTGRFDFSKADAPTFSWVNTQIAVRFTGTALSGSFSPPADGMRLLVLVNSSRHTVHNIKKGSSGILTLPLASGLPATGMHEVSVWKVTEDNAQKGAKGAAAFHGFSLPEGGSFGGAPARPGRRLEFVGDSDTAGWCADGSPKTGDVADKYEDSSQTWAARLAASLDSELMAEAISGFGVTVSSTPINEYATRTHAFDESTPWDFTAWTPHAILFLIGPNDEAQGAALSRRLREAAGPTAGPLRGNHFVSAYLRLLTVYTDAYDHVPRAQRPRMIHVCGGSLNGLDPCDDIQDAIGQFNAQHGADGWLSNYTSVTVSHWHEMNANFGTSAYNGCDGHYNGKGHQMIVDDIEQDVRRILGW